MLIVTAQKRLRGGDIPDLQISTYVKAFQSYRQSDRKTERQNRPKLHSTPLRACSKISILAFVFSYSSAVLFSTNKQLRSFSTIFDGGRVHIRTRTHDTHRQTAFDRRYY